MADGGLEVSKAFTPDPQNTRRLRDAFGRFASGVTIVTTRSSFGPVGITANSFTSLSLDPPLLLWAPAVASRRCAAFEEASHFAIHVLGAEQDALCSAFSSSGDAFDPEQTAENEHGVPLIEGCLARFECQTHAIYPGGDHKIIVGKIDKVHMSSGDALGFYGGAFRKISAS